MAKFRKLQFSDRQKKDDLMALFRQLTEGEIRFDIDKVLDDKKCHALVVEADGGIVGFGALIETLVPTKGYIARMEDIIVDEKFTGKGIGSQLIDLLIDYAESRGLKTIELTSNPHNPKRQAARHLYLKKGFEIVDTDLFRLSL